jgi:hypothetical protein
VSDREDANDSRKLDERDRIGEPSSSGATNPKFGCHAWVEREAAGTASDRSEHCVDLGHELETKTFTSLLVPRRCSG